jgi:hypothetical protein
LKNYGERFLACKIQGSIAIRRDLARRVESVGHHGGDGLEPGVCDCAVVILFGDDA